MTIATNFILIQHNIPNHKCFKLNTCAVQSNQSKNEHQQEKLVKSNEFRNFEKGAVQIGKVL